MGLRHWFNRALVRSTEYGVRVPIEYARTDSRFMSILVNDNTSMNLISTLLILFSILLYIS